MSILLAIDARTGKKIWGFDPEGNMARPVVDRGVAVYKGKLFVAACDGRLIALNVAEGVAEGNGSATITPTPPPARRAPSTARS